MDPVAGNVQADESLEKQRPAGPRGTEEDQQAGCGATIGHHVEHGTERSRLIIFTRNVTIHTIQQTGHGVKERTCARVEGHVVEGRDGKHDTDVS